eukprot:COSAG03_NODE_2246_length_2960_cov_2.024816_1_plen_191_part_00
MNGAAPERPRASQRGMKPSSITIDMLRSTSLRSTSARLSFGWGNERARGTCGTRTRTEREGERERERPVADRVDVDEASLIRAERNAHVVIEDPVEAHALNPQILVGHVDMLPPVFPEGQRAVARPNTALKVMRKIDTWRAQIYGHVDRGAAGSEQRSCSPDECRRWQHSARCSLASWPAASLQPALQQG